MVQKKRFIAGAHCSQCQELDSLRWWVENQIEFVECVACGYTEQRLPNSVQKNVRDKENMIGIFKPE